MGGFDEVLARHLAVDRELHERGDPEIGHAFVQTWSKARIASGAGARGPAGPLEFGVRCEQLVVFGELPPVDGGVVAVDELDVIVHARDDAA